MSVYLRRTTILKEWVGHIGRSDEDFAILTNKDFDSLVGSTVWLVTSKGQRPRRYFLCSSFIVDKVERGNRGRFKNRAVGSNGRDCDIEIGNEPWFSELMRTTGNFGLGLLPLSSKAVIRTHWPNLEPLLCGPSILAGCLARQGMAPDDPINSDV